MVVVGEAVCDYKAAPQRFPCRPQGQWVVGAAPLDVGAGGDIDDVPPQSGLAGDGGTES